MRTGRAAVAVHFEESSFARNAMPPRALNSWIRTEPGICALQAKSCTRRCGTSSNSHRDSKDGISLKLFRMQREKEKIHFSPFVRTGNRNSPHISIKRGRSQQTRENQSCRFYDSMSDFWTVCLIEQLMNNPLSVLISLQ